MNYFFKKILTILPLIAILIGIAIFVFPENAFAVLGTDTGSAMASNLRNVLGPIMQFLWGLIENLTRGIIFFKISTYLLQTGVNYSPRWIDVSQDNAFVTSGLSITTAMADIALIIVFVAIAIGYVFKIEGYNNQKILIKFFVSALLIHFAPLFVGMFIDISNIIITGIMAGKETIFTDAFHSFSGDIMRSLTVLLAWYGGETALLAVPEIGPANAALIVGSFIAGFFSIIPHFIIQELMLTTINGVVFSYAMFFLTRIFVMQILAVVAPLAILAGVLNRTKGFYDMWMQWLLGWSFGGILMLFLLVLGLSAVNILGAVPPASVPITATGGKIINIYMELHFHWFALAIYMLTIQLVCGAAVPQLAGEVTKTLSAAGGKLGGTLSGADLYKSHLGKKEEEWAADKAAAKKEQE